MSDESEYGAEDDVEQGGICVWENGWCITHDTDHGLDLEEKEAWEEA